MKISKLYLFLALLCLISISLGIFYYCFTDGDFWPLATKEESVPLELLETDNIIDSEALEILDDTKNASKISAINSSPESVVIDDFLDMIDTVTLVDEFRILFDPDNFKCGFNEKLSRRIKDKKGWLPSQIRFNENDSVKMNRKILKFKESSSAYIFNLMYITFKWTDNSNNTIDTTIQVVPEGSLLFENDKVFRFINKEKSSFILNFDCDGYYKAAVSAGIGGGRGSIRANANASQEKKVSAFVGMAYVYSPLQFIMETASTKINGSVPHYERFSHLASILALTRILGITQFEVRPTQIIKMVWSSNSGSNTLNNRASISASGSLVFVSGNANGGININRGASYTDFNSYLIGKINSPVGSYDRLKISERMARIFSTIEIEDDIKWINRDLVFSFRLNEEYCHKTAGSWTIEENGFSLAKMEPDTENRHLCKCTLEGDINSSLKRITLKGQVESQNVERVIDLPVVD